MKAWFSLTAGDYPGVIAAAQVGAEARVTLGVVAARQGDEQAAHHGSEALNGERKSLPSLILISRELAGLLAARRTDQPARDYLEQLRELTP